MKRQGKSRELCSLSAKMTTSFLSRYERFAFIGWQESMLDSRDGVKHAVLQGVKRNILLYKGKNAKALQMESMLLYAIFLLYMKKPCATSPLCSQGAHRPGNLILRHRPTSVQDVPTCELEARTDHELCSSLIPLCGNKGKHTNVLGLL